MLPVTAAGGTIVTDVPLVGAAGLTPVTSTTSWPRCTFPATAGPGYRDMFSELAFQFTAVQRDGAAR